MKAVPKLYPGPSARPYYQTEDSKRFIKQTQIRATIRDMITWLINVIPLEVEELNVSCMAASCKEEFLDLLRIRSTGRIPVHWGENIVLIGVSSVIAV